MTGARNHSNWWQFDANYKAPARTSPPSYRASSPTQSTSTITTPTQIPTRLYGGPPQPDTEMYSMPPNPSTRTTSSPAPTQDPESQTWESRLISLSQNQVAIAQSATWFLYAIILFVAGQIYTEIPETKLFTPVGGGPEMDWRGVILASMPKNNLWAVLLWFLSAAGLLCLQLAAMWGVLATLPLRQRRLIWMLQPLAFAVLTVLLGAIVYWMSTWL